MDCDGAESSRCLYSRVSDLPSWNLPGLPTPKTYDRPMWKSLFLLIS